MVFGVGRMFCGVTLAPTLSWGSLTLALSREREVELGRWMEVYVCRLPIACPRMDLPGCTVDASWGGSVLVRIAGEGGIVKWPGRSGRWAVDSG